MEFANVIAVNYKAGNSTVDLVVAVLKGLDNAARNGNAGFNLVTSLAYVSTTNTFETLAPEKIALKNTTLLGTIDSRTVSVVITRQLGTHAVPGGNPGYSATAQVVNTDANGNDTELGPPEQTFP